MSLSADLENLRSSLNIVEIIGEVVSLTRKGGNYFGCCPFHQEKTPSFSVSPDKQLFHCFGCKVGGDVFKFYELYHRVEFRQAVEDLAKRVGVDVRFGQSKNQDYEESIEILEQACQFFEDSLYSDAGKVFREYLESRKIPKPLWKEFRLGAHPGDSKSVSELMKRKGLSRELATKLGILGRSKEGGFVDRFRSRLMFSIADEKGQIRGFGGRSLHNEHPKYINSPASKVFDKKKLLYGMHLAIPELRRREYIVLVEGYLDVISLYEYGVKNVVGSMGTALTQDQTRKIKRWTHRVVSLYDGDNAGLSATERNLGQFISEGIEAKVALIPGAKDPDAFLHMSEFKEDEKKVALRKVFAQAKPAIDFLIDKKVNSVKDPVTRAKAARELVDQFDEVRDPVEREVLKQDLVKKLGLSGLEKAVAQPKMRVQNRQRTKKIAENLHCDWGREMLKFLVLNAKNGEFSLTDVLPYLNSRSKWSILLKELILKPTSPEEITSLGWLTSVDEEVQSEIREWIILDTSPRVVNDDQQIWKDLLKRIQQEFFENQSGRIQQELVHAEDQKDEEGVRRLLVEKRDLVELMKSLNLNV